MQDIFLHDRRAHSYLPGNINLLLIIFYMASSPKMTLIAETPMRYDVIVVGAGNAALCAALSAHEYGARVLILEAAPKLARSGNTRFAGCVFRAPHAGLEAVKKVLTQDSLKDTERVTLEAYTAEDYRKDLEDTSDGKANQSHVNIMVEKAWETIEWMKQKGVHWELILRKYYNLETQTGVIHLPPGSPVKAVKDGIGLTNDLWAAIEAAGITVLYESPAHRLLVSGDTVYGVKVRLVDRFLNIEGQVILACGGFSANPAMRRKYLGQGWDLVTVRGTQFNTGTMLESALAVGARPCGHWGAAHASPQDINAPLMGEIEKTPIIPRYSYPYGITVNIEGNRFFDEGESDWGMTYAKTGKRIADQPGAKSYQIFDQKVVHLLQPRYSTAQEIKADTIPELAQKLKIPVHALSQTIRDFNAVCSDPSKYDPHHKDGVSAYPASQPCKSNWALQIDKAPFIAYGVTCGITFTYGGLDSDERARVLNKEGKVMPGLWCTGEISGGLFYHNYPGGAGLVKGAVFGRIAGRDAAVRAKKLKLNAISSQIKLPKDIN
jgi:tricarballylate dehydrogenase